MKLMILSLLLVLFAGSANAWYPTDYDTLVTKWPNGNIKEFCPRFQNGGSDEGFRPHGEYRSYYENGQLRESGVYRWGEKLGVWTSWDSIGNKLEEISYLGNIRVGMYYAWYPSHNAKIIGRYNSGLEVGLWTFRLDGDDCMLPRLGVDSLQFWVDGTLLIGPDLIDKDETSWPPEVFNDSLGLWVEFSPGHKIFDVGKKVDGKKQGRWCAYDRSGSLYAVYYYDNDTIVYCGEE